MEADDWLRTPLEGKSPEEKKIDGAFNCWIQFFCKRYVDCLGCAGKRVLQVLMNGTAISSFNIITLSKFGVKT